MPTKAKPKPNGKQKKAAPKGKKKARPKTRVRGGFDRGQKRWYTDDERENFKAVIAACDGNVAEAARRTGVSYRTLYAWHRGWRCPEALQLCQDKAGKLADALEELAWLFAAVAPERVHEASLKELATSLGTVVDKMRILRGESTSNILAETRSLSVNATLPLEEMAKNYAKLSDEQRATFTRLLGVVTGRSDGGAGATADERVRPIGHGEALPAVLT